MASFRIRERCFLERKKNKQLMAEQVMRTGIGELAAALFQRSNTDVVKNLDREIENDHCGTGIRYSPNGWQISS